MSGIALSVVLLAACSSSIQGSAVRRQSVPLDQVLPSPDQVADAAGNPLDPAGPEAIGSITLLPNGIRDNTDAEPLDCLGAATPLMRVVYEKGDVQQVALRDYARYGEGLTVSSVHTGVVRFSSDAEAARVFASFVAQWRRCEGTVVRVHVTPTSDLQWKVADVRSDGAVLSDVVLTGGGGDQPAFPTEHALGLAADCIVEADVAVTDPDPARRVPAGRAAGIVTAMLKEISASR